MEIMYNQQTNIPTTQTNPTHKIKSVRCRNYMKTCHTGHTTGSFGKNEYSGTLPHGRPDNTDCEYATRVAFWRHWWFLWFISCLQTVGVWKKKSGQRLLKCTVLTTWQKFVQHRNTSRGNAAWTSRYNYWFLLRACHSYVTVNVKNVSRIRIFITLTLQVFICYLHSRNSSFLQVSPAVCFSCKRQSLTVYVTWLSDWHDRRQLGYLWFSRWR
jgi:hypothetical protein